LISQLCLAAQTRKPLGIYVSLDTLRDYIYVDDAAALIVDFLDTVAANSALVGPVVKIIASQQSVSIAQLLGTLYRLTKHRPPVVIAASPLSAVQTRDLRFRSIVLPELDDRPFTPLPVGMANCITDVSRHLRNLV
jgi:UDP-glucose 4-epimerase